MSAMRVATFVSSLYLFANGRPQITGSLGKPIPMNFKKGGMYSEYLLYCTLKYTCLCNVHACNLQVVWCMTEFNLYVNKKFSRRQRANLDKLLEMIAS